MRSPVTLLTDLHSRAFKGREGGQKKVSWAAVVRRRASWANWFALRLAHWVVGKDKHVALLTFSMELASESELDQPPLATSHKGITLDGSSPL